MKRILAGMMLVLALPAMREAKAGVDVSLDFFYDNLESDGSWVEVADYGYCWQPNVAVSNVRWRPYWDGYWAYTDVGWTWVSYEDFGWATYHYGRWLRLRDRGWVWLPGRVWGPAWVSWRTGGDYVGWAPLPPRGGGEVDFEDRPIGGQVDVEFDIGPSYYNFVEVRYIGEPVLRERIFEPSLNVTYISTTVNVTNITYASSTVYNYGPDYDALSRYSMRPIRRMKLERETNVDPSVVVKSGPLRVQGDKLVISAPLVLQKPAKPIAPKMVKEKIAKSAIERGWDVIPNPKTQAELKQKMKSEDPKNVPPPSFKPRDNAEAAQSPGATSPGAPASGAPPAFAPKPASAYPAPPIPPKAPASPATTPDKGKDRDKRLNDVSPIPTAVAPGSAVTPAGKPKSERFAKPPSAFTPSSNLPGITPAAVPKKPFDRRQNGPSSLATSPDGTPFREGLGREKEARKDQRMEKAPEIMPPTRQPSEPLPERATRKPKNELPPEAPTRQAPPDTQPKRPLPPERVAPPTREAPPEAPRKHPLPPERTAPVPPGPAANPPAKPEAPHKGPDRKSTQPAPSPGQ